LYSKSYKDLIPKVAIIRQEDACWRMNYLAWKDGTVPRQLKPGWKSGTCCPMAKSIRIPLAGCS